MNVAQDMENWRAAFPEPDPFVCTSEKEALSRLCAITEDESTSRRKTDPSLKEKDVGTYTRTSHHKLQDDVDATETEPENMMLTGKHVGGAMKSDRSSALHVKTTTCTM